MAILDYTDVISLRYAQLSPSAKAVIPVLATVADKKTGLLPSRFSKLDILANFAGICRRAVQDALVLLKDTKGIALSLIPGNQEHLSCSYN